MELPKPAPKSGGTGVSVGAENYLKIEPGETVNVVFRGQPLVIYQRWPSGGEKEIFMTPEPGSKPRYLWNAVIYDKANKKFVAKVWEMASMTYERLYKINAKYPLEETKIEIERTGSGKNTKYNVLPLVGELDDKALKAIAAVQLNILHREPTAEAEAPEGGADEEGGGDSLPF